jgi:hypothetical protein
VKWPAGARGEPPEAGGLFPQVLDQRVPRRREEASRVRGVETPTGYSLVQVTKVIESEKVDDAQRDALGRSCARPSRCEELEATLASLRERVGVTCARTRSRKKRRRARS